MISFDRQDGGGLDLDRRPDEIVREGQVGDLVLQKLTVGNHDLVVGQGFHPRAAGTDAFDHAADSLDFDQIADPDRLLGQQDQATDEVVADVLAAEADADGRGSAQERKGGKGKIRQLQRDETE